MRGIALWTACVVVDAVCSLAACGGDVVTADAGRDAGASDGGLDSGGCLRSVLAILANGSRCV